MVRKNEKRNKQKNEPVKKTRKTKAKKKLPQNARSQAQSPNTSELDFTLPDGNHLDSFDILRCDEHKALKEKNILKPDVRASFNRDSSIEYDSEISRSSISLSTSSVILIQDIKTIDQIDLCNDESASSENSKLFSYGLRTRKLLEGNEAEANAKAAKTKITKTSSLANPSSPISPAIAILRPQNGQTSTPQRLTFMEDFDSVNQVGIDGITSNTMNLSPRISHLTVANDFKSPVQRTYVVTRRQRLLPEIYLTYSPIQENAKDIEVNTIDEATDNSEITIDMSGMNESKLSDITKNRFKMPTMHTNNDISTSSTQNQSEVRTRQECNKSDTFDSYRTSCHIRRRNETDSSSSLDGSNGIHKSKLVVDMHSVSASNDAISVSSASSGHTTTLPTTSSSISNTVEPKNSVKARVGFNVSSSIHELSKISQNDENVEKIIIKSGKWRRTIFEIRKNKITQSPQRTLERISNQKARQSIRQSYGNALRRKSVFIKDIPDRNTLDDQVQRKSHTAVSVLDESDVESICSSDFSPKSTPINAISKRRSSRLQPLYESVDFECNQQTLNLTNCSQLSLCGSSSSIDSVINEIENSTSNRNALKVHLLKRCGQSDILPFDEIYSPNVLTKCQKIGEGVFGEVYLNDTYVLKIIPIEGDVEINGAQQKRFEEILQEVIISQELSALRHGENNRSAGFVEVLNVRLVEGRYPEHLLDLWDKYDTLQVSENDRPDVFGDDQLYIVFELANCGSDLEAHEFKNAEQSFSAFKQLAISLAVAETQFEFEHRDLHWGNILIAPCTEKSLTFHVNGKPIEVRTHGIKATIIDYTLSRIVYKNCCLFQDLAADPELFEATGDYQYDIYRLMRTQTKNFWEIFEPYTNVLWLHYTIDKMICGVNYTTKKGVKHRQFIDKMIELRDELQEYRSATDFIETSY